MSKQPVRNGLWVTLSIVGLSLLGWSIRARMESPSEIILREESEPAEAIAEDAVLLIDLDDDIAADERTRLEERIVAAIAPVEWTRSDALGVAISEPAQLYRLDPPDAELAEVVEALRSIDGVEGVEAEGTWHVPMPSPHAPAEPQPTRGRDRHQPNDPYYRHQWHLDQIEMPFAWSRTRGEGVVVAVIDTGILYRDHGRFRRAPDLVNTGFVEGYDFVDRDAFPDDEHGHGTHVAGTVAQSTNNGLGVAGVAPGAQLMPIRVLDRRGAGRYGSVAAGIRWAADHGAHVINLSLGGPLPSSTIRRAIEYAHRKGVVTVAAAGNSGRSSVGYPARYPNVIAVGAVRYDETLAFYSQYGRGLDLVAPGGDLRVDQNADGLPDGVLQNTMVRGNPARHDYMAFQGTSMAAPHVAGVAALLRSAGITDPAAIERILKSTAKSKSDARRYGAGVVQADAALTQATQFRAGARGLAAIALAWLGLLGLRRRQKLGVRFGSVLAGSAVVAGGLACLPWHLVPSLGDDVGQVFASAGPWLAGHGSWVALIGLSALIPLVFLGLGFGIRRAREILVGIGFGFAAILLVEAALPTAHLAGLPSLLIGPWLLLNTAVLCLVFRVAAIRAP